MIKKILSSVLLLGAFYSPAQINSNNPTVPFGSNKTYAYGIMPTTLPATGTYGQATEAATYYNQWKTDYVENCGSDKARVKFDQTSYTVSEGIAYGMLLSAYAGDKPLFDKLWAYYKNFKNSNGVMHWKINGCNTVDQQNGATDAELDAALALIVASKQWPSTTSPHNYVTDAKNLINAIKNYESSSDGTFFNGDLWHPDCRNPSYQAPAYCRVFKPFMSENGFNQDVFWDKMANGTETLFKNNAHATSGLSTNWCLPSGMPSSSCSGSGTAPDKFGYDACRAPWRQGVDYLWWGATASGIQTIVDRQADFWWSKGGASVVKGGDGFNHDGSGNGNHDAAFTGMIGAMSLATSSTQQHQSFCNGLYSENKQNSLTSNYFTKILQMVGLFVQTGNFWNPYPTTSNSNQSPNVTLNAPLNGFKTCLGVSFSLNATASDADGTVKNVEFYEGTKLLGSVDKAPFLFNVSGATTTSGQKIYTAKAYDDKGASRTSSEVLVSISNVQSTNGDCGNVVVSGDYNAAIDDFDSVEEISLDALGTVGIFWWVGATATSVYKIKRATTGMTLTMTNAAKTYESFGVNFGANSYLNLKDLSNANIKLDIKNNSNTDVFITLKLIDTKNNSAEIFPADPSTITWDNRWKKIGLSIPKGQTVNQTLDLSAIANNLGGLAATAWGCATPVACPTTAYKLDPTKIKEIVFIVNGGATTADNPSQSLATGDLVFNYFSIGEIVNTSSNIIKKGVVISTPDADNDGVADATDQCASTPSGVTVNTVGCATSQLDTDKDGIKDNLDQCASTASGATVNSVGCATSQLDTDKDGIKDNLDQCANTPSGKTVNSVGCATSQLDTDKDGVKDDVDVCPNTKVNEAVAANGCPAGGLEDVSYAGIQVYPIPASGLLTIEQNQMTVNTASFRSVSGLEVSKIELTNTSQEINIESLEKGVYILILEGQNTTLQRRIVIE